MPRAAKRLMQRPRQFVHNMTTMIGYHVSFCLSSEKCEQMGRSADGQVGRWAGGEMGRSADSESTVRHAERSEACAFAALRTNKCRFFAEFTPSTQSEIPSLRSGQALRSAQDDSEGLGMTEPDNFAHLPICLPAHLPISRPAHLPTAHFPLDILPEGRYLPLVCLPKSNENALNFCKEPWTC